jgi:hypothetical protein
MYMLVIASFAFVNGAMAQIPVEVFAGNSKTSFDLMFFRFVKNKEVNSKFLFFNRNRVSIDYKQTGTTNLPSFGFTEAFSYNHPNLKGFAPVVVAQINNKGTYPKVGIQYFHRKNDFTFFSWVVSETLQDPNLDLFILTRYEPKLTDNLTLFAQLELVNVFPTESNADLNLFQRVRVGFNIKEWQFGPGADFSEFGKSSFANTTNIGGFLRHEF